MQKNVVIIVSLTTAFAHGMAIVPENKKLSPDITTHNVILTITKKPISSAIGADLIVVGRVQQHTLLSPAFNDNHKVGEIEYQKNKIIYQKHPDDESASDDDTYQPFISSADNPKKLWKRAQKHTILPDLYTVVEPRIHKEPYPNEKDSLEKGFFYYTERCHQTNKYAYRFHEFTGNEALEQAAKDLKTCYLSALNKYLTFSKRGLSIALPALGTEVGFPRKKAAPIAIATILQFIEDFPTAYDRIELFVKKRSEFELYKKLLQQYAETK